MPCIIDNNKEIVTSIKDIILAVRQQSMLMNINKLKDVTFNSSDAIVTCPHHKNGQENTPACYVLLQDMGDMPAGTFHCFSCNERGNIVKFVSECLNISYRKATEWLLGFVDYRLVDTSVSFDFTPMEISINETPKNPFDDMPTITTDELKKYDYIHPYMFQRKLTDEVIDKFEVGYDPELDCLTFPVYVDGRCLFVARRKVKYKQFIMPKIEPKPIYGLDYVTGNEVIVCESVINALTCYVYGKEAIALFGTGSKWQIEQLCKSNIRKFILALDPDEAGNNGTQKLYKALTQANKLVSMYVLPKGKDINDLSKEEFENLQETF